MKRFGILFDVRSNLRNFNKEAAIDSLRNVLAVLGLGVLIGDFATMHLLYVVPGAALLLAVWYADYLRHDLPVVPAAVNVTEREQRMIDQIDQFGRAS